MLNLELKARFPDLRKARRIAARMGLIRVARDRQCDTYFQVRGGLLKVRQSCVFPDEVIYYRRTHRRSVRPCQYWIVRLEDGGALRTLLAAAHPVTVVVRKTRDIYLFENVRIHLDRVAGLGSFIEFEAVERYRVTARSRLRVALLRETFAIRQRDVVGASYSQLLQRKERKPE